MQKYVAAAIASAGAVMLAVCAYAKFWEYRQPEQQGHGIVQSVEPFVHVNDLHFDSTGYNLRVSGTDREIRFEIGDYDNTVKVGDSVDIVVKRAFPLFSDRLKGLKIDDRK